MSYKIDNLCNDTLVSYKLTFIILIFLLFNFKRLIDDLHDELNENVVDATFFCTNILVNLLKFHLDNSFEVIDIILEAMNWVWIVIENTHALSSLNP